MIATTEPMLIILAIGCLILAFWNIRLDRLKFETKTWMAVAWMLIIAIVAFVAGHISA